MVFSTVWITTLALRVFFLYSLIHVSFVLLLLMDIGIGVLPILVLIGYCFVTQTKKNIGIAEEKKGFQNNGLEAKYAEIYDVYLSNNYESLLETLKPEEIIFRWKFIEKTND